MKVEVLIRRNLSPQVQSTINEWCVEYLGYPSRMEFVFFTYDAKEAKEVW